MFSSYSNVTYEFLYTFDASIIKKLNLYKRHNDLIRRDQYERALNELSIFKKSDFDYNFFKTIDPRLIIYSMINCHWVKFNEIVSCLKFNINDGIIYLPAVTTLYLFDDPDLHQRVASYWVNKNYQTECEKLNFQPHNKIRIGYFSPDFRDHALMVLMAEVLELHDKENFQIYAFNTGEINNDKSQIRMRKCFDFFFDVANLNDDEIVELSRRCEIDVAVNLIGFFGDQSRPKVFSKRCAPVQISYMYAGTMAMANMDYIIADRYSLPEESQKFYKEKITYLPELLYAIDSKCLEVKILSREALGLPQDKFIYLCLNAGYKLNPSIFEAWIRILKSVENAVLVLRGDNPVVVSNLLKYASGFDIAEDAIIFISSNEKQVYYSLLSNADLFLDTFPYSSHTVAMECAWFELPLLSLRGESYASRIASSVFINLGLDRLVSNSLAEYERLAIHYFHNRHELVMLRETIRESKSTKDYFDSHKFVKDLEDLYRKTYREKSQNRFDGSIFT